MKETRVFTTFANWLFVFSLEMKEFEMGFRQTATHRSGKKSYHQIGVFTGQPRGAFGSLEEMFAFLSNEAGLDAVELASWDLDLQRAETMKGASAYAKELYDLCTVKYGLDIVSYSTHLQGQVLGDMASAKTLQFIGGEAQAAYVDWRMEGNKPEADNPYYVPSHVAELMREKATMDQLATCHLAFYTGELNGRNVPVSSFTGSAGLWSEVFPFPPTPKEIGGINFHDRLKQAYEVIKHRFTPIWNLHQRLEVRWGLECHPTEIAIGDEESAAMFLEMISSIYGSEFIGFNFDASHMLWQGVCPLSFIRRFGDRIWSVHHKGVRVSSQPTKAGILGGYQAFGTPTRGWDFVFAGSNRDSTNPEAILTELHRVGFDGAITLECEDNDFNMKQGLIRAANSLREIDMAPAEAAFDAAFVKK